MSHPQGALPDIPKPVAVEKGSAIPFSDRGGGVDEARTGMRPKCLAVPCCMIGVARECGQNIPEGIARAIFEEQDAATASGPGNDARDTLDDRLAGFEPAADRCKRGPYDLPPDRVRRPGVQEPACYRGRFAHLVSSIWAMVIPVIPCAHRPVINPPGMSVGSSQGMPIEVTAHLAPLHLHSAGYRCRRVSRI